MLDQRGRLLRVALGFAGLPRPSYDRALWALRTWLDSWSGIGHVAVGMAHQGFDLQLTRYDERGWRATFYTTGMEHSPTSATGTAWERTPWHAAQRAALNNRGGVQTMIGTSVVASVLLILVLVSGAPAFNEPDGFRGVPWGTSQEQVRTTLDFSRQNREDCTEITRDCQDLFWLGDIPIRTIYRFRNGRLTGVFLHFKSRESAKLAAILVERYGAATKEKQEQFKTRGGVTASNQHLRWEGPKVVIDFWQFMGSLDEGLATILTREEIQALDREVQEQTKDAAKGL